MDRAVFDFAETTGRVKPMHAVNNGPIRPGDEQYRNNFEEFVRAGIPFIRNHDASFCADYGGEHSVDVHSIFTDFDADENDPSSYDFTLTDKYLRDCLDTGAQVFYRLGTKIEHWTKRYATIPPRDFEKWARICEHIIMHYNEGWADGYEWNIIYWEIWNEPDGKPNWTGTPEQYYELYSITATRLKRHFPNIKIGGPALAFAVDGWIDGFLDTVTDNNIPLDFFSWHCYTNDVAEMQREACFIRDKLNKYGLEKVESILNEWNYIEDFYDNFLHSIKMEIGMKGAAYQAACMCMGQNGNIDMLMYYDARPCGMNGLFDFYTLERLKGYYPLEMFNVMYKMGIGVSARTDADCIYAAAAKDKEENASAMICYYSEKENMQPKEIEIKFENVKEQSAAVYLLDEEHNCEKICETNGNLFRFTMQPDSVLFITGADMYL